MTDCKPISTTRHTGVALPHQPFLPHRIVRSGHIQTLLARRRPLRIDCIAREEPILLDAGPSPLPFDEGRHVRLLAYYTPPVAAVEPRGLVLMLHGWEGCSHSNYDIMMTDTFTNVGFAVVRLNFRDHGPNRHVNRYALNRGLFLGTLLEEAAAAVRQIAAMTDGQPLYMVGVSMGGNFALRLAGYHQRRPFANLAKVIAVNPAVNPARATDLIDSHRVYRHYFRKRWLASLLAKQALFPDLYAFDDLRAIPTIRGMTERLVQRYHTQTGGFQSADEYFAAYTVQPAALAALTTSVTIISALDDPVIDAADLLAYPPHPLLVRHLHPTGGHVGFVNIFPFQHHLPTMVLDALLAAADSR